MENMIPTQEFKDKLQQLQAKRSVTNQLRTHLRHLIMNELQSGPTAKSAPTLTNRSRAIGSLIVEWLQMHDCHYTLTVLSTEIPGFTEFPALVNEDGAKSLRTDGVNDILVALGLQSPNVIEEYSKSTDSLISCIFKVAENWKNSFGCRDLPQGHSHDKLQWGDKLEEIVSKFCIDQTQLPSFCNALHNLFNEEIRKAVNLERHNMQQEMVELEEKLKKEIMLKEESMAACLKETEDSISLVHGKLEEDINEKKQLLASLVTDFNHQCEAVLKGLETLADREQFLEVTRQARRKRFASERAKTNSEIEEIRDRMEILKVEKERLQSETRLNLQVSKTSKETSISPGSVRSFKKKKKEFRSSNDYGSSEPSTSTAYSPDKESLKTGNDKILALPVHDMNNASSAASKILENQSDGTGSSKADFDGFTLPESCSTPILETTKEGLCTIMMNFCKARSQVPPTARDSQGRSYSQWINSTDLTLFTDKYSQAHRRLQIMNNIVSTQEFKEKLQQLHMKRRITNQLRTHLRHLILSEIQSGPTAKSAPPLTNRSRALGSLIVEWLQMHDCHYTLSVLSSEIPSFSDLPALVGDGDQRSLKTEEVDDILIAIGLKNSQIRDEYVNTTDSLLSCIIKTAESWKERLEFRELPMSPSHEDKRWCLKLKEIVSKYCVDESQLSSFYVALQNLVENEIQSSISKERQAIKLEMMEMESRLKGQVKLEEDNLVACLKEAEDGLNAVHEKVEEDIEEKKNLLSELVAEVNLQHEAVFNGLRALAEREKHLEASRHTWKEKVAAERVKRSIEMDEIREQMKILKMEKELLQNKKPSSTVKKTSRGTCTSPVFDCDASTSRSFPGRKDNLKSSRSIVHVIAPYNELTRISSSTDSLETPLKVTAAWKRLKELQRETEATKDAFLEYRGNLEDSDSSLSDSEIGEKTIMPPYLAGAQMTFPNLREGCHSESNPSAFAQHRRSTKRYRRIMNQGDLGINRCPPTDFSRFQAPMAFGVLEATRLMQQESAKLENLLQSARTGGYKSADHSYRSKNTEKEEKAESLVNNIRPRAEEDRGEGKELAGDPADSIVESPLKGDGQQGATDKEEIAEEAESAKEERKILDIAEPDLVLLTKVKTVPLAAPNSSLIQAALLSNSDLSEGEVSAGRASEANDFWE